MSELFEAFGFAATVTDDIEKKYDMDAHSTLFDMISENEEVEDIKEYMNKHGSFGVDYISPVGRTPLMAACKRHSSGIVTKILQYPKLCNMGHVDFGGDTALIKACEQRYSSTAFAILKHPNLCNMGHAGTKSRTALATACIHNHRDVVSEILSHWDKCNPSKEDWDGYAAISHVISMRNNSPEWREICESIMKEHPEAVDVYSVFPGKKTFGMLLIEGGKHMKNKEDKDIDAIISMFDSPEKCHLGLVNNDNKTSLSMLIDECKYNPDLIDKCTKMLDYQGDWGLGEKIVDTVSDYCCWGTTSHLITACRRAAGSQHIDKWTKLCLKIIDHPTDCICSYVSSRGITALDAAMRAGMEEVVLRLLDEPGVSYGYVSPVPMPAPILSIYHRQSPNTVLYNAIGNNMDSVALKVLTKPGECMINHVNHLRKSAMVMAAQKYNLEIISALMDHPECVVSNYLDDMCPIVILLGRNERMGDEQYWSKVDDCVTRMIKLYNPSKLNHDNKARSILSSLLYRKLKRSVHAIIDVLNMDQFNESVDEIIIACHLPVNTFMKLIGTGAYDIDHQSHDPIGHTCLMEACAHCNMDLVERLLYMCHKDTIGMIDDHGETALSTSILQIDCARTDDELECAKRCYDLVRNRLLELEMLTPSQLGRNVPIETLIAEFSSDLVLDHIKANHEHYKLKDVISLMSTEKLEKGIECMKALNEERAKLAKRGDCMTCCNDTDNWVLFPNCNHVICACDDCMDKFKSCPMCRSEGTCRSVFIVS